MHKTPAKIIIIGGGIAGLSAAQAAREANPAAQIHLICAEKTLPYYRTRICELLSEADPEKLTVRNAQWFIDNSIEVVYDRVLSIDTVEKQVVFSDGSYLPYSALVLATGANGTLPEIRGADAQSLLALRFLADIDQIKHSSGPVALVGGGLLGLEAAWRLSQAGRPVTIIERDQRLLAQQLDHEAGTFILNIVENTGIRVALQGLVERYGRQHLILSDGRAFEAGLVIYAAGIRPNINLAQTLGLATNRAIIVDAQMLTSLPDIYACGDCAEYAGKVEGLWTTAMSQGKVAGQNAAGISATYQPEITPYTLQAMGTQVWSMGQQTELSSTAKSSASGRFVKLFFDDNNLLSGAILIGETGPAVALKKAISEQLAKGLAEQQFLKLG